MERALPLLTAAVLVAAVAGCSAVAENATAPPPATASESEPAPSAPAPDPAPLPASNTPAAVPAPVPSPEQELSGTATPDAAAGNSPGASAGSGARSTQLAAPDPAPDQKNAPPQPTPPGNLSDGPPATGYTQDRPTGEAKARIVVGTGAAFGQAGHGAYVCKLISTPTVSLYSAGGSMSGSGVALAVEANESGTTVLELPAGEINLTAYCTDPGGVGPAFTGTSAAFVVTEGGSTDVEITATPHP
ncbi:hypothetical protein E4J89_11930 [Arthrobacter sp. CAU 1506]|uniref:hypothetical protein n=1 Tax=Arthrobacter sp. CAU 1506 TaxID=2560052 RepID=UPI0010AC0040|nr:hypothetical protein [Arthrobacter sp. CAU 1506]TJY69259.1 hypothetical protein E4J89_11930 [Arthrobacter sp. CAU 1506]